jgi:IclR family transcriptional regulator, acetate operon repressor
VQNRPVYAIESVDRALRLAALLQHEGRLRVTDAAETLGISASGTHRLLAMLVYRGFAEQLPDRSYGPGPVLRTAEPASAPVQLLRQLGPPHLRTLVDRVHESANLVVRVGTEVRFLATVESDRALRVGDRTGRALPAHLASGGKALLATLTRDEVTLLYDGTDIDGRTLRRSLDRVRTDGYAVNRGDTEDGVTAVGIAVTGADGRAVCAVSVALPSIRFTRVLLPRLVEALTATRRAIERELRERG